MVEAWVAPAGRTAPAGSLLKMAILNLRDEYWVYFIELIQDHRQLFTLICDAALFFRGVSDESENCASIEEEVVRLQIERSFLLESQARIAQMVLHNQSHVRVRQADVLVQINPIVMAVIEAVPIEADLAGSIFGQDCVFDIKL